MLLIKQLCCANTPTVTVPSPAWLHVHQPHWGSRYDMSGSCTVTSCRHREAELLGTALRAGQEQPPPLLAWPPKAPALKKCCPATSCLCSQQQAARSSCWSHPLAPVQHMRSSTQRPDLSPSSMVCSSSSMPRLPGAHR